MGFHEHGLARHLLQMDDTAETHGPDDEIEDVNERIIARLRGYAEAAEDDEAVQWLADCLAFCKSEAGVY